MASKGKMTKMASKAHKAMHELKENELHSGSKKSSKANSHKPEKEHKQKELHDHPTLRMVGRNIKNSTAKEDKIRAMMSNTPAFA